MAQEHLPQSGQENSFSRHSKKGDSFSISFFVDMQDLRHYCALEGIGPGSPSIKQCVRKGHSPQLLTEVHNGIKSCHHSFVRFL